MEVSFIRWRWSSLAKSFDQTDLMILTSDLLFLIFFAVESSQGIGHCRSAIDTVQCVIRASVTITVVRDEVLESF